jgi:hypothetical protein
MARKKTPKTDARTGLYVGDAADALDALAKRDGLTKSAVIR